MSITDTALPCLPRRSLNHVRQSIDATSPADGTDATPKTKRFLDEAKSPRGHGTRTYSSFGPYAGRLDSNSGGYLTPGDRPAGSRVVALENVSSGPTR